MSIEKGVEECPRLKHYQRMNRGIEIKGRLSKGTVNGLELNVGEHGAGAYQESAESVTKKLKKAQTEKITHSVNTLWGGKLQQGRDCPLRKQFYHSS